MPYSMTQKVCSTTRKGKKKKSDQAPRSINGKFMTQGNVLKDTVGQQNLEHGQFYRINDFFFFLTNCKEKEGDF